MVRSLSSGTPSELAISSMYWVYARGADLSSEVRFAKQKIISPISFIGAILDGAGICLPLFSAYFSNQFEISPSASGISPNLGEGSLGLVI